MSNLNHLIWPRAIIFVDMNAFFASIEQLDFPKLRGKPVAITNGTQGTCIITCSYEARQFGIHTGMRLKEAKQRCPKLIRRPSRPKRYAELSSQIMQSLEQFTPDLEVFSIDEAFLDVTHCQQLLGEPEQIGQAVKQMVYDTSGLTCSVGVSGDKTTAKYLANLYKPDGFACIQPEHARAFLAPVPVEKLCGIGKGIQRFLAKYNVHTCGEMAELPISLLKRSKMPNVIAPAWQPRGPRRSV